MEDPNATVEQALLGSDASGASGERSGVDLSRFRDRSLKRGVNPFVYWTIRALFVPFFLIYLRMKRIGRAHIPRRGPLILASNHRSFLDPFVIGTLVRRPVYYMAKRELFEKRFQGWILNALGAFPVDRGTGDHDAIHTARTILERGDCVVIFPEGTRTRPGGLGVPRRGVGRLALETGAPVVPVAVFGTEAVRRGWRIRPHKVTLRAGQSMRFPEVADPSPALALAVTERVWAYVSLQWEWLGGQSAKRPRRAGRITAPDAARAASDEALSPAGEAPGVPGEALEGVPEEARAA